MNDSRFLIRNHKGQKEVAHISHVLKEELPMKNYIPSKIAFMNERKSRSSQIKETKRVFPQQIHLKIIAKENSENRVEMITEGS